MLIETQQATQEELPHLLATLQGCWKSSSLLWMHANGFPVLSGLVLSDWSHESEEAVARFCRERNLAELLLRIEKRGERWIRRRGGYTIPVHAAHGLVDELAREGMLAVLLEPASPNADRYSLTSVCDLKTGRVDLEAVGPGFDASDILRGDTTPHERFEAILGQFQALRPRRLHLIEPDAYRASAQRRLTKIGARLRNPSFPDEVLKAASGPPSEQLAQEAVQYLKKTGQTLLLDHLNEYEPIPSSLLEAFLSQLLRLFRATAEAHAPWKALSIAGSVLEPSRLLIWDFFPPGNGDTRFLASMTAQPFLADSGL